MAHTLKRERDLSARFKSLNQLGNGAWRVHGRPREVRKPRRLPTGRRSISPEKILADALVARFGKQAQPNYKKAIPGRRFEIDVAFPRRLVAIEIDGWQYHGKFLRDFKRDREKDRVLTEYGWRILRFTAGEVRGDVYRCVSIVERVLLHAGF